MSKKQMVTARKGTKIKQFTQMNWDAMPKDKYGWELLSSSGTIEAPPETIMMPIPDEAKKVSIAESVLPDKPAKKEPKTESKQPAKAKAKSKK